MTLAPKISSMSRHGKYKIATKRLTLWQCRNIKAVSQHQNSNVVTSIKVNQKENIMSRHEISNVATSSQCCDITTPMSRHCTESFRTQLQCCDITVRVAYLLKDTLRGDFQSQIKYLQPSNPSLPQISLKSSNVEP